MRILGIEITRVPKDKPAVWHRATVTALGVRITDMTPDELRTELAWVLGHLEAGRSVYIGRRDPFRRILATPQD